MRKPRTLLKGASYHVTAKINRSEFIFKSKAVKQLFMDTVKRAKKKYKFGAVNFVIMDNHIHIINTPRKNENLSRIMQWILSVFAINYNKAFNLKGHVWYDRFHSVVIKNRQHMADVFKYVRDNPIKAEMVAESRDYPYGGVYYILKGDFSLVDPPPDFLQQYVY